MRLYLVVLVLSAAGFVPHTVLGQFRSDGYGNLVWDPAKQIWVVPGRESFARRLLDERPGATVDALAEGTIYALLNDRSGAGSTSAIIGGTCRVTGTPLEAKRRDVPPQIPTHGPDGRPLGPGTREFLADFYEDQGYGSVGRGTGQYGDAVPGAPAREDVDGTPVVASVHLEGIGELYLTAGGNGGLACQPNGRVDYRETVLYSGVGSQTFYPWNDATGPVREIVWVVDPYTDRIQFVQVRFADGGTFRLDGDSGHGGIIDPVNPYRVSGGPITALRPAPGDPTSWVELARKPRTPSRKATAAPEDPPPFGLIQDTAVDALVDYGADRGLEDSLLGPPPLTDTARGRIVEVAARLAALGEEIGRQRGAGVSGPLGELLRRQRTLAAEMAALTEAAARGASGFDRVRVIIDALRRLEATGGGADLAESLGRLRALRDDTIIHLPGGAGGAEPVLYGRLFEVANAAARIRALYDAGGPRSNPALWAAVSRSRADAILTGFQQAAHAPPKKDAKVEEAKDTTPKPPRASGGNIPVPLSGGGTGTAPAGGDGPVTMPDGSVVYRYPPGRSIVSVTLLPPGPSGKRATVTVMGDGSTVVVQEDGTRVEQGPRGRKVILQTGEVVVATGGVRSFVLPHVLEKSGTITNEQFFFDTPVLVFEPEPLLGLPTGFSDAVRLGFAILVVGGADPENVNIQGFVVNAKASGLDLSVFGFDPLPLPGVP